MSAFDLLPYGLGRSDLFISTRFRAVVTNTMMQFNSLLLLDSISRRGLAKAWPIPNPMLDPQSIVSSYALYDTLQSIAWQMAKAVHEEAADLMRAMPPA